MHQRKNWPLLKRKAVLRSSDDDVVAVSMIHRKTRKTRRLGWRMHPLPEASTAFWEGFSLDLFPGKPGARYLATALLIVDSVYANTKLQYVVSLGSLESFEVIVLIAKMEYGEKLFENSENEIFRN
jgi:hypothetical protein